MFSNAKIRNFIPSLALASLLSLTAFAQAPGAASNTTANTAAAPVSTKIGIMYIQEAIGATNEGQKEADALQKRFGPKNNDLRAQNDELENLKKQLQAQGDKLNDEERAKRAKEIDTKQKAFQRNAEDFQAEVQSAEQDIINRLGQKMLTVLDKYARANGYSVVLDVSSQQTPVLWASQGTNITKDLVDAYNVDYPAVPPAAPKPAATGAAKSPAGAATKPASSPAPAATTPKK